MEINIDEYITKTFQKHTYTYAQYAHVTDKYEREAHVTNPV